MKYVKGDNPPRKKREEKMKKKLISHLHIIKARTNILNLITNDHLSYTSEIKILELDRYVLSYASPVFSILIDLLVYRNC